MKPNFLQLRNLSKGYDSAWEQGEKDSLAGILVNPYNMDKQNILGRVAGNEHKDKEIN